MLGLEKEPLQTTLSKGVVAEIEGRHQSASTHQLGEGLISQFVVHQLHLLYSASRLLETLAYGEDSGISKERSTKINHL